MQHQINDPLPLELGERVKEDKKKTDKPKRQITEDVFEGEDGKWYTRPMDDPHPLPYAPSPSEQRTEFFLIYETMADYPPVFRIAVEVD